MINFTMVVQNFISKYSQHCHSSLIPGVETFFLRAKGNPGLVYFAKFVQSARKQGHNGDGDYKFSQPLSTKSLAKKQAPEVENESFFLSLSLRPYQSRGQAGVLELVHVLWLKVLLGLVGIDDEVAGRVVPVHVA